ncbi:MAG: efflux RND transporter periplasmic adaptor subunit [Calditrichaeota bacterium]|nr:efflux RND transporter periplasmic adaptor subunit [Calditrichota bacterium]
MKNRRTIIGIVIASLIVLVAVGGYFMFSDSGAGTETEQQADGQLWTCGMHPEVILDKPGNCPICGMKLVPVKGTGAVEEDMGDMQHEDMAADAQKEKKPKKERKILYWRAPMDPTEIYDRPGKSKMGMDLIPVYEDEAELGAGGTVRIDPVTVQNMGIRMARVEKRDFHKVIRTVGYIEYNEKTLYTVSPKISGWIERLYVDFTGQMVYPGQPLLEIYSPELVTTQEEYLLALNNLKLVNKTSFQSIRDGAESLLKASLQRLKYWDIPDSEIRRLEETGEVRKTLQLQAPARGVVIHKNAVEGSYVKEGQPLYQIADLSTVWVYATVYDHELPWIELGQEASMELSYLPGKTFKGRIIYIYPYLDKKARDVKIRMEFENPDLELRPGMYANVMIKGKTIPDALVIPSEAVIRSGVRNIVFVVREPGKFEPRQVKIGEEGEDGLLRILSGLLPGEKIVVSAQFMLDSESRLQEAIQKLLKERMKKQQSKGAESRPDEMEGMDHSKPMNEHAH